GASNPFNDKSHLYLVDGSAYIFRAFHALPPLTRPSDGLPTGAVHGFCQMLWKLVADSKDGDGPSHFAVIFDHSALSFRNEIYDDYKSNRPPPPEELVPQFPLIREATQAFNLACIEQEGFEADDIIATYADQARARGGRVTIVSSDKDLMQLIGDGVVMLDPMKNRVLDADAVMEKFGVGPDRVIDVQALWGDTTDNVPGVPGIGQKTAAALIEEYGDLDTLLARAEEIKQKKRRENLIEFADQARISRDLVTLKTDMTLTISLDDVAVQEPEDDTLLGFLRQMEFNTLTRRIADGLGVDAGDIPTPKAKRTGARAADKGAKSNGSGEGAGSGSAPSDAAVEAATAAALTPPIDTAAYVTVTEIAELENWIAEAIRVGHVA
ncbi:MAG: 5'-3' exonuclease H3TH domain-containing protein, partial [Pseudomonadota bacterium]